jgi:hypothetical protein
VTAADGEGRVDLGGVRAAPSQVWGGIRLVPLLREEPYHDLRLYTAEAPDGGAAAAVRTGPRTAYVGYVPHALVAAWDGADPAAAYGTQLREDPARGSWVPSGVPLRSYRRMARRVDRRAVRFLPQHLALEGYLSLHFGGPSVVWDEWSRQAVRRGLSPRAEQAYTGAEVAGLREALRVFEIHEGQCGVLVYAADALAAAFVLPHPEDYLAVHRSLIHALYGETIYHYARLSGPVPDFAARIDDRGVDSLAALRGRAEGELRSWTAFHDTTLAGGLLTGSVRWERVYRMGRFALSRFLPPFRPQGEQCIGEAIADERGRTAYLSTFRLTDSQIRRGHLLTRLAAQDWHLGATAEAMGVPAAELVRRLEQAGFAALLRQDVRDHYRAARRRGG